MAVDQFYNGHGPKKEKENGGNVAQMVHQLIDGFVLFNTTEHIGRPAKDTGKQGRCGFIEF